MSLEEVLAARDARAAFQAGLLATWGVPVLSMTLVSPGPVKDDARRRKLMDLAENALESSLRKAGYRVLAGMRRDGPSGPETLRAVKAPPLELKALAVRLEEGLLWGRLLDADVVTLAGSVPLPEPIPRSAIGLPPRPCLSCGRDARHCMAERTHPQSELALAVDRLIDSAFA